MRHQSRGVRQASTTATHHQGPKWGEGSNWCTPSELTAVERTVPSWPARRSTWLPCSAATRIGRMLVETTVARVPVPVASGE